MSLYRFLFVRCFILICQALLLNDNNPSPEKIKTWLSSNICRCTGYKEIEESIRSVINNIKNQLSDVCQFI
ncbi:2Fe-2S iron-sulfur cluster-binding protein [Peribacillus loiseleuriae]|uniref:2Fe-2S iron-sulfur cluster-binding protein n=1 Tax=Peribacillus loiseleuriae TaxID=1679170 RepID=UPI003CFF6E69